MRFVYDNLAAIYIALQAAVLAWLFGGTRGSLLVPVVPWLLLFLTEIAFVFPQKRAGETTCEARERVWRELRTDPLVWTALGLLVLLAVPFVNYGLCANCDFRLIAQGFSPDPPLKFLPFCVNRLHHLHVYLWFASLLSSVVAVRHCLRRRGKRLVLALLVWNGFALAILGFVQTATKAEGPFWQSLTNVDYQTTFFSTFGYPNMAGDYFTTLFGLSAALWRQSLEEVRQAMEENPELAQRGGGRWFWCRHFYLIPAALSFFAALNTLSRAAILLVSALAAVFFVHTFFSLTRRMSRATRIRKGTWALVIAGVLVFFASLSIPEDMQREVDTLDSDAVLTRVTGKGDYHVRVSTELWKDHLLFGCGGWGYKHFCVSKMTPEEIKELQHVGGINVHNDYLQFLAEHGLVGFGALVAIVLMLLFPVAAVWRVLAAGVRFLDAKKQPAKPVQIFALPAPAFFILMTALATFIHGFADCPLRSPAVLTLFGIELAAIPGFLPKVDLTPKETPEKRHHRHASR